MKPEVVERAAVASSMRDPEERMASTRVEGAPPTGERRESSTSAPPPAAERASTRAPSASHDPDRVYRPWNVRRPNGTRAALPNNGELRAWIADGRVAPHDELSPDGQHWTPLHAIENLDVFIASAPPTRARRTSSLAMTAVRPSDAARPNDSVRPPSVDSIPSTPKVPSLVEAPVAPIEPARAPSVHPPSRSPPQPTASVPPPSLRPPSTPAGRASSPLSPLAIAARAPASVRPPPAIEHVAATPSAPFTIAAQPSEETSSPDAPPRPPAQEPSAPVSVVSVVPVAPASAEPNTHDARAEQPAFAPAPSPEPSPTASASAPIAQTPPTEQRALTIAAPQHDDETAPPPRVPAAQRPSAHRPSVDPPTTRPRSVPPPPSIAVDPSVYEDKPSPPSQPSQRVARAALALALVALSVALVALAKALAPRASAPTVTSAVDAAIPSPRTLAEIDEAIERCGLHGSANPTLLRARRARLLALRSAYLRGLADDLEALARRLTGEDSIVARAEARLLRRSAAHEEARAASDAAAIRTAVPPREARAEWALALAQVAILRAPDGAEADGYLAAARAAGAPVHWLEAQRSLARDATTEARRSLELAESQLDAPTLASLTLARLARSQGRIDEARSKATRLASELVTDEAPRSILRSLGEAEAHEAPRDPERSHNEAPPDEMPARATVTPPPHDASAGAPLEYATRVRAGRRWLERRMLPRARAEFRRALEVEPNGVEAQVGLAWVALRIGYYPVATRSFRRLITAGHNTPEVRAGLGLAHARLREREPAVRYLRSYLAAEPHGSLAQEARRALAELGES